MMRVLQVGLFLVSLIATPPVHAQAPAPQKMGFVDLQRAFSETDEGKKVLESLRKISEKRQKELDGQRDELKQLKEELDRQSTVLKPEVFAVKRADLARKAEQMQETYVRLQSEIDDKKNTAMHKLLDRMAGVISAVAQAEGVTFVLERNSGLLYAPPSLDLTNELIRRFNALGPGATVGSPPPAPAGSSKEKH